MQKMDIAKTIAERLHKDQVDKLGVPYIRHIEEVVEGVTTEEEKIVAYLHDVVEDTDYPHVLIYLHFGKAVADAVYAITKRKGEPLVDYYERVRNNPLALKVKLADLHDNSSEIRLQRLDADTQKRLRAKYQKAYLYLLGEKGEKVWELKS